MSIKELKIKGKEIAFKNKFKIFIPLLVFVILCYISSVISTLFGGFVAAIVGLILFFSLTMVFVGIIDYTMNITNNKQTNIINSIITQFTLAPTIIKTITISYIATILWTVMLIIPGIIYLISISMILFLLAEVKDTKDSWSKIITTSRKMMFRHEFEYIKLNLSFIGWIILGIITLGIGFIWVVPYILVTNILYFKKLKEEFETEEITMPKLANK